MIGNGERMRTEGERGFIDSELVVARGKRGGSAKGTEQAGLENATKPTIGIVYFDYGIVNYFIVFGKNHPRDNVGFWQVDRRGDRSSGRRRMIETKRYFRKSQGVGGNLV